MGPLTNPAGVSTQVIGIFDTNLIEKYLEVLIRLDYKRAMVLASKDGLDEISIASNTIVGELVDGKYRISNSVLKNLESKNTIIQKSMLKIQKRA